MSAADVRIEFRPLNELERLLAAGEPDDSAAFRKALLETELYVMPDRALPKGQLRDGDQVNLVGVRQPDGRLATAVFTHAERLMQTQPMSTPYLRSSGLKILETVRDNPVVLNPGLPHTRLWTPAEVGALLGTQARPVETSTQMKLGLPNHDPVDLIARLKAAFEPEPGVTGAWLALARWPQAAAWSWYFDVHGDIDRERASLLLNQALQGADANDVRGLPVDLAIHAPGAPVVGLPVITRH